MKLRDYIEPIFCGVLSMAALYCVILGASRGEVGVVIVFLFWTALMAFHTLYEYDRPTRSVQVRELFKRRGGQIKTAVDIQREQLQSVVGPNGRLLMDTAGVLNADFQRILKQIVEEEDTYPSHIFPQPDQIDCL